MKQENDTSDRSCRHLPDVVAARIVFEAACLQASLAPNMAAQWAVDQARARVAAIIEEADAVAHRKLEELLC